MTIPLPLEYLKGVKMDKQYIDSFNSSLSELEDGQEFELMELAHSLGFKLTDAGAMFFKAHPNVGMTKGVTPTLYSAAGVFENVSALPIDKMRGLI